MAVDDFNEDDFNWAVEEIKAHAQDDLWRFLYTPKTTLTSSTKLALFAINPHLSARNPLLPEYRESREDGNAWRLENFEKAAAQERQRQVKKLFKYIADGTNTCWDKLMDRTLTSNICPLMCSEKEELDKYFEEQPEIKDFFDKKFWHRLCANLELAVVICLSKAAYKPFKQVFTDRFGVKPKEHKPLKTGWHTSQYEIAEFNSDSSELIMVNIPLLAGGCPQIIINDEYADSRNEIVNRIVTRLKQPDCREWLEELQT